MRLYDMSAHQLNEHNFTAPGAGRGGNCCDFSYVLEHWRFRQPLFRGAPEAARITGAVTFAFLLALVFA